jgi:chromate transporter
VEHTGTTDDGRKIDNRRSCAVSIAPEMSQPTLGQIGSVFARYANLTLGGGSATTAVIHGEIVSKRLWVSEEQFALSFALGRLTPGTNLLAFCVGIGWILRKWSGAIVALVAASIPCTLIVVVITVLFADWQDNSYA